MPHGEFEVALERKPDERADATGIERVEFQVKLNPGQPFGPLAKMASGGELSRISLAIEVVRSGASPGSDVRVRRGRRRRRRPRRRDRRPQAEPARRRAGKCYASLTFRRWRAKGSAHYRVVKLTDGKTSRTERARAERRRADRGIVANARRHRDHRTNPRARRGNDRPGREVACELRLFFGRTYEHEAVLFDVEAVACRRSRAAAARFARRRTRSPCPSSRHTI